MKNLLFLSLACFALTACSTDYHFRPYVGQQQNWATSPGSYVERVEGVDIYSQLPSRPYEIVGAVEVKNIKKLAKAVRIYNADAALVSQHQYVMDGTMVFPGEIVPVTREVVVANLIRFKK